VTTSLKTLFCLKTVFAMLVLRISVLLLALVFMVFRVDVLVLVLLVLSCNQGHPVNVKHDARCVMGKVGGRRQKTQTGEIFIYCYKFEVIG